MTKKQVFNLLKKIALAYPSKNTEITQDRIDAFYESLINHDFHDASEMLKRYIDTGNKYPPSLGDLIPVKRKEQSSEIYSSEVVKWSNNAASLEDVESIIRATKLKLKGARV
ncbi:replicative helicase loader/inhibitor [Priestia taiwanensis]|uniref:Uncharacterized protein n=1 Tax=Priestia taiwanensis TaxID=1347902 RepID=A0A917AKX1_9BACI|nr:replicative helicase loader/inhibitor [Priestia taiwanensis]MBM7361969.1 hypothetical protein [Priestia taiwanensis]GGE58425.1 hypothetical protein GCM10007140_05960 [Priestia taiwanensis]